jgi:ceroid-lipofuscinosis MFS transporter 7
MPDYIRLLAERDPKINVQMMVGVAVSLFSLGRLLSTLPLGIIVDRTQSTRNALVLASIVSLLSSAMYGLAALFDPASAIILIVASRFILGFGSGTLGVSRAYMALVSTDTTRTRYIAWNTLMQYCGAAISPGIALVVTKLFTESSPFLVAAYVPAGIVAGMNILMLIMLLMFLPRTDPMPAVKQAVKVSHKVDAKSNALLYAFYLYCALNFSLRGMISVVETYGGMQGLQLYGHDATDKVSLLFTLIGAAGIGTFFLISPLERRFGSTSVLLVSMALMMAGSALLIPASVAATFIAGLLMINALGGPICQTLIISSYSKLLGSKPQATDMAWLTTMGGIGRIVFPLIAGADFVLAHALNIVTIAVSMIAVVAAERFQF